MIIKIYIPTKEDRFSVNETVVRPSQDFMACLNEALYYSRRDIEYFDHYGIEIYISHDDRINRDKLVEQAKNYVIGMKQGTVGSWNDKKLIAVDAIIEKIHG